MSRPIRPLALFLDIDGTLIELAPKPHLVVVPDFLPPLLRKLAEQLDGALALISGRALAEVDRLFPGLECAAGSHGGEWRLGGSLRVGLTAIPELEALAAGAETLPGILVERKPMGVAMHYRDNPQLAGQVRALARRTIERADQAFRLIDGKSVVEVVPAGIDKGTAITRFMDAPVFAGRTPVYVGDDVTDECGFRAVNRLDGVSIRVGGTKGSAANRGVSSPQAVRRWLKNLHRQATGGNHVQS